MSVRGFVQAADARSLCLKATFSLSEFGDQVGVHRMHGSALRSRNLTELTSFS